MKKDFINNHAYIVIFKSNRKNAKCADPISIYHLINHNANKMISDEKILLQFISTLDTICANAENLCAKQFIIKTTVYIEKNAIVKNSVTGKYNEITERFTYDLQFNMNTITMLISYLFNIFALIYPYTTLSRKTILTDASVKYIIDKYGKKDAFGIKWKYSEELTNEIMDK